MTKSISETLYAAADLLSGEGRWTQGSAMRNDEGGPVASVSQACSFCLFGAYNAVDGVAGDTGWDFIRKAVGGVPIQWNDEDGRTQSEVVAKLREAGDKAREAGL